MTDAIDAIDPIAELRAIVGPMHVLTGDAAAPFATGYRYGGGQVEAAVRPGSLVEMWRVLLACTAADRIIVPQAANTGLTGGSTPHGDYDRPVVVLNTSRLSGIRPIGGGTQVIAHAGATLYDLERVLTPLAREPHSVIGSSCIGASVVGGVCNNSGGALVRRGPAYTEYALYARVGADRRVNLCNRLGVTLGDDPETVLTRLDTGSFDDGDVLDEGRAASAAVEYGSIVRDVNAATPARFNADPARLFEASGSAGRIVVFAVRLDTFPKAERRSVFYIGTNDTRELTTLRRRLLTEAPVLPVSGEYIHRRAFDLADDYGRDTVQAIRLLGTRRLPLLFRCKAWIDRLAKRLPGARDGIADRLLQSAGRLLPDPVPPRLRRWRDAYEHHLILDVADEGVEHAAALLSETFPSLTGDAFRCSEAEASRAMLHRFAVAGAAVRYRAVHADEVQDIVAVDVALPRNAEHWFEALPPGLAAKTLDPLYYGHFLCHVFHQDYLIRRGEDPEAFENELLAMMAARGAECPAEHNVGHLYHAKPALTEHYRALDPANVLNPGIGRTSRRRDWA